MAIFMPSSFKSLISAKRFILSYYVLFSSILAAPAGRGGRGAGTGAGPDCGAITNVRFVSCLISLGLVSDAPRSLESAKSRVREMLEIQVFKQPASARRRRRRPTSRQNSQATSRRSGLARA